MNHSIRLTGLCFLGVFFSYASLFILCAKPSSNRMFGSNYDRFEYPKIPAYGTPDELRALSYRLFQYDFEDAVDAFFRPAFELDRKFGRRKLWIGLDFRDVGPRMHPPNTTTQTTASPSSDL